MTSVTPLSILFLVFLLEFKHFVCDGPLQTQKMVVSKAIYGDPLGLLHAAIHGVGSLAMLLVAGVSWSFAVVLALAEAATHYHIDFFKENIVKRQGWTTTDRQFWWALTADQALHHFTYLVMAAIIVLRS